MARRTSRWQSRSPTRCEGQRLWKNHVWLRFSPPASARAATPVAQAQTNQQNNQPTNQPTNPERTPPKKNPQNTHKTHTLTDVVLLDVPCFGWCASGGAVSTLELQNILVLRRRWPPARGAAPQSANIRWAGVHCRRLVHLCHVKVKKNEKKVTGSPEVTLRYIGLFTQRMFRHSQRFFPSSKEPSLSRGRLGRPAGSGPRCGRPWQRLSSKVELSRRDSRPKNHNRLCRRRHVIRVSLTFLDPGGFPDRHVDERPSYGRRRRAGQLSLAVS